VTPRGLSKADAATYCGCSTLEAFSDWVRRGIVPGAMPGTNRWDLKAIDLALDKVSNIITPSNHSALTPYQRWKADNAANTTPPHHTAQS
jgi:hypothetical protein